MRKTKSKVVVIGGGIAGLSAAYFLKKESERSGHSLSIKVLEANQKVGGLIQTTSQGGVRLEQGPDSILAKNELPLDLCRDIGLEPEIITPPNQGGLRLLHHDQLVPLPAGFKLMAPTRWLPLFGSRLFSLRAKLRMWRELSLPPSQLEEDESLYDFLCRRLGPEVCDRVVQPILANIFLTDTRQLSVRAAMPQLLTLLQKHGSLIRGLGSCAQQRQQSTNRPSGGFFTLRNGLSRLPAALLAQFPQGVVQTGTPVERIQRRSGPHPWQILLKNQAPIEADGIIMACPARTSANLLRSTLPHLSESLSKIEYASCVTLNLIYEASALARLPAVNGFFIPSEARLPFIACNFIHIKFPERVPNNRAAVRLFLAQHPDPALLTRDSAALVDLAHRHLKRLFRIQKAPLDHLIFRHRAAMPKLKPGFLAIRDQVQTDTATLPCFSFAGGAMGAVGIPNCIRSGRQAALNLLNTLGQPRCPTIDLAV